MNKLLALIVVFSTIIGVNSQVKYSNEEIAKHFADVKSNTNKYKDLWGIDLYGAILLVDPTDRQAYANFADTSNILQPQGDIFVGKLPEKINFANTSLDWQGRHWAMIMLPLPTTQEGLLDLVCHELFHASQSKLELSTNMTDNSHLDKLQGRIYLRLELQALLCAMKSDEIEVAKEHILNALIFRQKRYTIFPNAKSNENPLEINEGLASYTGVFMSGRDDRQRVAHMEDMLSQFLSNPTFVRSFAYHTVPIYGFVLNRIDAQWNKKITKESDLSEFFLNSFALSLPEDMATTELMSTYDGAQIVEQENRRAEMMQIKIDEYKSLFVENPHLTIILDKMSFSFDPRNVVSLDELGTVYPTTRISDNWGILTVNQGALMSSDWKRITVSKPTSIKDKTAEGLGWTLELNEGYRATRDGDNYTITKE